MLKPNYHVAIIAMYIVYQILAGVLFSYSGLQLFMWWLIYEAMIFFMIYFPFKTRVIIQSKKVKYVHILSIVIGLTVPLYSPVMGSLVAHNVNICTAFTFMIFEILYYTFNLPLLLLLCVGSTLLVLIYWKLYNVSSYRKLNKTCIHFFHIIIATTKTLGSWNSQG